MLTWFDSLLLFYITQSVGAVGYTDSTPEEGWDPTNECLEYEIKQSDGEVPVMLELFGMRNSPSLPSLPGSLWPAVVARDRVLSMGQIELNWVLMLNWIVWNRTVLTFNCEVNKKLYWY